MKFKDVAVLYLSSVNKDGYVINVGNREFKTVPGINYLNSFQWAQTKDFTCTTKDFTCASGGVLMGLTKSLSVVFHKQWDLRFRVIFFFFE